eukprot:5825376-Amphidinium_carterae.1
MSGNAFGSLRTSDKTNNRAVLSPLPKFARRHRIIFTWDGHSPSSLKTVWSWYWHAVYFSFWSSYQPVLQAVNSPCKPIFGTSASITMSIALRLRPRVASFGGGIAGQLRHGVSGQTLTIRVFSTREAYHDMPDELQKVGSARRGKLFEKLSMIVHERQGWLVEGTAGGLTVKGHSRGAYRAECDYMIRCPEDGTQLRVEVKSSSLLWNKGSKTWYLLFSGVKLDQLDVLMLGVLLPSGAALWEYDLRKEDYLYTTGKRTDTEGKR